MRNKKSGLIKSLGLNSKCLVKVLPQILCLILNFKWLIKIVSVAIKQLKIQIVRDQFPCTKLNSWTSEQMDFSRLFQSQHTSDYSKLVETPILQARLQTMLHTF